MNLPVAGVMRTVLDRVNVSSIRLDEPHIEEIYLETVAQSEAHV